MYMYIFNCAHMMLYITISNIEKIYKNLQFFFIKPVYCQPQEVNIKFDTMFNNS